jgi:hypothetical protein
MGEVRGRQDRDTPQRARPQGDEIAALCRECDEC